MKEADKVPFLDAPVSSGSLFGPAVEGFAERFTETQKSSQAMRYFLGAEESVFMDPHGPTIAPRCPTAVIADKIKHNTLCCYHWHRSSE